MTLATAAPPVVFPHQPADHALLQRVMEQERIARAEPGPEWSDYLVDLARAAFDAMPALLSPVRNALAGLGLETAAAVLLALLAALITALAVLAVLRLVRRGRPATLARDAVAPNMEPAPRDPAAWRALLEERLRAGGVADALEAVWWWLAASVSRGPVDPSWTSRELLVRAGRPDLGPWAAALDRMAYGPGRPAAGDVRDLVDALESAV
jgi:hypothetical protein